MLLSAERKGYPDKAGIRTTFVDQSADMFRRIFQVLHTAQDATKFGCPLKKKVFWNNSTSEKDAPGFDDGSYRTLVLSVVGSQ